jgi:hypothetical protein
MKNTCKPVQERLGLQVTSCKLAAGEVQRTFRTPKNSFFARDSRENKTIRLYYQYKTKNSLLVYDILIMYFCIGIHSKNGIILLFFNLDMQA